VNHPSPSPNEIVHGVVAVLPRDGCLLVIQRAAGILAGGTWCFPGGAIEPGETAEAALIREIDEELGVAVRPVREIWQCDLNDGNLVLHWWLTAFAIDRDPPLHPNPSEVADARWLAPAEIAELPMLLESNRLFLVEWEHLVETGGVDVP
jgi:8-oxo-dGTP diphosphatase